MSVAPSTPKQSSSIKKKKFGSNIKTSCDLCRVGHIRCLWDWKVAGQPTPNAKDTSEKCRRCAVRDLPCTFTPSKHREAPRRPPRERSGKRIEEARALFGSLEGGTSSSSESGSPSTSRSSELAPLGFVEGDFRDQSKPELTDLLLELGFGAGEPAPSSMPKEGWPSSAHSSRAAQPFIEAFKETVPIPSVDELGHFAEIKVAGYCLSRARRRAHEAILELGGHPAPVVSRALLMDGTLDQIEALECHYITLCREAGFFDTHDSRELDSLDAVFVLVVMQTIIRGWSAFELYVLHQKTWDLWKKIRIQPQTGWWDEHDRARMFEWILTRDSWIACQSGQLPLITDQEIVEMLSSTSWPSHTLPASAFMSFPRPEAPLSPMPNDIEAHQNLVWTTAVAVERQTAVAIPSLNHLSVRDAKATLEAMLARIQLRIKWRNSTRLEQKSLSGSSHSQSQNEENVMLLTDDRLRMAACLFYILTAIQKVESRLEVSGNLAQALSNIRKSCQTSVDEALSDLFDFLPVLEVQLSNSSIPFPHYHIRDKVLKTLDRLPEGVGYLEQYLNGSGAATDELPRRIEQLTRVRNWLKRLVWDDTNNLHRLAKLDSLLIPLGDAGTVFSSDDTPAPSRLASSSSLNPRNALSVETVSPLSTEDENPFNFTLSAPPPSPSFLGPPLLRVR